MKLNRRDLFKSVASVAASTTLPAEAAEQRKSVTVPEPPTPELIKPPTRIIVDPGSLHPEHLALSLAEQMHWADRAYFADSCIEFLAPLGATVKLPGYRPFVLQHRETCAWEDKGGDRYMKLGEYSRAYLEPAALALTYKIRQRMRESECELPVCGMAVLPVPGATRYGWYTTLNGVAVRVMADYSIADDKLIMRADVLYGITTAE